MDPNHEYLQEGGLGLGLKNWNPQETQEEKERSAIQLMSKIRREKGLTKSYIYMMQICVIRGIGTMLVYLHTKIMLEK